LLAQQEDLQNLRLQHKISCSIFNVSDTFWALSQKCFKEIRALHIKRENTVEIKKGLMRAEKSAVKENDIKTYE